MLYVDEEESIKRQMSRGISDMKHNELVQDSGEGQAVETRVRQGVTASIASPHGPLGHRHQRGPSPAALQHIPHGVVRTAADAARLFDCACCRCTSRHPCAQTSITTSFRPTLPRIRSSSACRTSSRLIACRGVVASVAESRVLVPKLAGAAGRDVRVHQHPTRAC